MFGCVGSSLLRVGFLQLRRAGATLRCGVRASHCGGFSCCRAWALEHRLSNCDTRAQQLWLTGSRMQAQQLWSMGLVSSRHVGSSRTRAQTSVPCIGRWILNHCATGEVPCFLYTSAKTTYHYRLNAEGDVRIQLSIKLDIKKTSENVTFYGLFCFGKQLFSIFNVLFIVIYFNNYKLIYL